MFVQNLTECIISNLQGFGTELGLLLPKQKKIPIKLYVGHCDLYFMVH